MRRQHPLMEQPILARHDEPMLSCSAVSGMCRLPGPRLHFTAYRLHEPESQFDFFRRVVLRFARPSPASAWSTRTQMSCSQPAQCTACCIIPASTASRAVTVSYDGPVGLPPALIRIRHSHLQYASQSTDNPQPMTSSFIGHPLSRTTGGETGKPLPLSRQLLSCTCPRAGGLVFSSPLTHE